MHQSSAYEESFTQILNTDAPMLQDTAELHQLINKLFQMLTSVALQNEQTGCSNSVAINKKRHMIQKKIIDGFRAIFQKVSPMIQSLPEFYTVADVVQSFNQIFGTENENIKRNGIVFDILLMFLNYVDLMFNQNCSFEKFPSIETVSKRKISLKRAEALEMLKNCIPPSFYFFLVLPSLECYLYQYLFCMHNKHNRSVFDAIQRETSTIKVAVFNTNQQQQTTINTQSMQFNYQQPQKQNYCGTVNENSFFIVDSFQYMDTNTDGIDSSYSVYGNLRTEEDYREEQQRERIDSGNNAEDYNFSDTQFFEYY